jgi:thiamine biosynthesis lipoprotein ApbE
MNASQRITLVPTGDERPCPPSQDSIDAAKARIKAAHLRLKDARRYVMSPEVRESLDCISVDLAVALEYLR